MKFTVAFVAIFASIALALPTDGPGGGGGGCPGTGGGGGGGGGGSGGSGGYKACTGELYSSAQCCATDVLGVADLDCKTPPSVPSSAANFKATCAAIGQRARCCVIPVLGQAVLCETPLGVTP